MNGFPNKFRMMGAALLLAARAVRGSVTNNHGITTFNNVQNETIRFQHMTPEWQATNH
jgi:hypothetical protein